MDTPEPEMSFDDLFGGTGWKPAITASPTREDTIISLYGDRMKTTGAFDFVTSTRIKKPLSERSYFYLVYGTRHPEGLLEFRRVEEREILEQEGVRMDAQQLERVKRTGQADCLVRTIFRTSARHRSRQSGAKTSGEQRTGSSEFFRVVPKFGTNQREPP